MASDSDLRSYADTWIHLSGGLLLMQLAILTYIISGFEKNDEYATMIFSFGTCISITSLSSVAIFLASRDPRQIRFSLSRLIDFGVGLTAASLAISAAGIAYYVSVVTGSIVNAWLVFFVLFFSLLIFYPFLYFRYLSNQKSDSPKNDSY